MQWITSPVHREIQGRRWLAELAAGVSWEPVAAIIARRGACRFLLATTAERHLDRLAASVRAYGDRWAHADQGWPDWFHGGLSTALESRLPASVFAQAPARACEFA